MIGFLRIGFSQKPTLKSAFITYDVEFLSGFSKVGFVENHDFIHFSDNLVRLQWSRFNKNVCHPNKGKYSVS